MSGPSIRAIADDVLSADMPDALTASSYADALRDGGDWLEVAPGLMSVAVRFDLATSSLAEAKCAMARILADTPPALHEIDETITLPTRYGGAEGPDLKRLAADYGLNEADVVERHAASRHRVELLGFQPGFAYLCGLDPRLEAPRLARPRLQAPAGSVGVAGLRTGVYPFAGPGGWRLIGRTEATLFDPAAEPPFLLKPGVRVRFEPV